MSALPSSRCASSRETSLCAGLDLTERIEPGSVAGESSIEGDLAAVDAWPLPVIAVVQGGAIAGGNELALHCDLVVASTRAS